MTTRFAQLTLLALTWLGCAGAVDDAYDTASEPLVFAPTGAAQPGIRPTTFDTCIEGDTAQLCVVPNHKDFVYFFAAGTPAEKAQYRALIAARVAALRTNGLATCNRNSCWKFREATVFNDPALTTRIIINGVASNSLCPGLPERTRSLYCFNGPTRGLIKSTPLSGTYNTWNGVYDVSIDDGEIESRALLTTQKKNNLRTQVVGAIVLGAMGKGLANIGNNRCNNIQLNADVSCESAPAEACFGNGFGDDGDQDHVGELGADCGN